MDSLLAIQRATGNELLKADLKSVTRVTTKNKITSNMYKVDLGKNSPLSECHRERREKEKEHVNMLTVKLLPSQSTKQVFLS